MSHPEHPLFLVRKENTAWHEAGHCLAGIKLGSGVERVELFPGLLDDDSMADGVTTFKDFRSLCRADAIKCLLAGPLVEKRIGASGWQKSKSDFDRIDKLLNGSGIDFKQIMAETERLLTHWWVHIELLQYELFHRRVMVEAEILEGIRPWRASCTN
jgi:hypothetical protein